MFSVDFPKKKKVYNWFVYNTYSLSQWFIKMLPCWPTEMTSEYTPKQPSWCLKTGHRIKFGTRILQKQKKTPWSFWGSPGSSLFFEVITFWNTFLISIHHVETLKNQRTNAGSINRTACLKYTAPERKPLPGPKTKPWGLDAPPAYTAKDQRRLDESWMGGDGWGSGNVMTRKRKRVSTHVQMLFFDQLLLTVDMLELLSWRMKGIKSQTR